MTQEKAIPAKDSWGTRKARDGEPAVTFQVTEVDPVKEHFTVKKFIRYLDGGVPLFGRVSTISFDTWRTNRYQPCEASVPPMAVALEILDRQEAGFRLRAKYHDTTDGTIGMWLDEPRAFAETFRGSHAGNILEAYVRHLDHVAAADSTPPVAVFVPPEPADVKAEIAALRGDVAGIREDFRALVDALRSAAPQLGLKFGVAA